MGGGTASQVNSNPAAQSTFLAGARDVKRVGTETVDGEKTVHYAGTATVDELAKTIDKKQDVGGERKKSLDALKAMGLTKLDMDIWVGDGDRTKQFRMRGDTDKGPLDTKVTFLEYNEPVTIDVPPAKDTYDLAQMMKDARAQG